MGGIQYVYWPGTTTRLTPWMLYCLQLLDADLQRLFGVRLALDSSVTQRGIRTNQEQVALFLSRYRPQASGSGPFGDVRYWRGRRYVRYSGLGTVAQPDTSNHEIQGDKAAIDLADTGGAGIGTMGSERSNWLRKNAANYGLIPEGFGFAEAWHYAVPNIFTPVPAGNVSPPQDPEPAPIPLEDITMNPIINVVAKVGDPTDSGVLWYARDDGTFQKLTGHSRELISVMLGALPDAAGKIPHIIPTVADQGGDFGKVKALWREMKKR